MKKRKTTYIGGHKFRGELPAATAPVSVKSEPVAKSDESKGTGRKRSEPDA